MPDFTNTMYTDIAMHIRWYIQYTDTKTTLVISQI